MTNTPSTPIYSIYLITNLINNKKYVGFTSKNPQHRFKKHCRGSGTCVSNTIKKYGKENFTFEVILQGWDREDVLGMETYFIEHYNTLSPSGYNLTTGGEHYDWSDESRKKASNSKRGIKHSAEHRKNSSEARKGVNNHWFGKKGPMTGRTHSEETKRKMSETHKNRGLGFCNKDRIILRGKDHPSFGRKVSNTTRQKMRDAKKNITPEQRENYSRGHIGKSLSEEHKRNISIGIKKARLLKDMIKNTV